MNSQFSGYLLVNIYNKTRFNVLSVLDTYIYRFLLSVLLWLISVIIGTLPDKYWYSRKDYQIFIWFYVAITNFIYKML